MINNIIFLFVILLIILNFAILIVFLLRSNSSSNNKSFSENDKMDKDLLVEQEKLKMQNEMLDLQKEEIENRQKKLKREEKRLNNREEDLDLREQKLLTEYRKKNETLEEQMYKLGKLSENEVKQFILEKAREKYKKELYKNYRQIEEEIKLNTKQITNSILLNSMENSAVDITNEVSAIPIKIPDEELKGKFIGREGRNIKTLENLLKVNIIIDERPNIITVSSLNPVRRVVGQQVVESLVKKGIINQVSIEITYDEVAKKIEDQILEKGKEAVDSLDIIDFPLDLIKQIGILYFRSSYGQNVLNHSIETAKIAGKIAVELDLDANISQKAALLHDIGKIESQESDKSHDLLGESIVHQYLSNKEILNAIAAHHERVSPISPYAEIVKIADKISASRPGVRNTYHDDFYKRVKDLEDLALNIKGVDKSYALNGGKEIRVIVETGKVLDADLQVIAEEIKDKIEKELTFPGVIKVTVLKENRYVTQATN